MVFGGGGGGEGPVCRGSGISGLSFDSRFLSPLLFFFCCSFCVVIFLLMVHSPDFFFLQKTLKYLLLRVRLFCMALVEQVGYDSW